MHPPPHLLDVVALLTDVPAHGLLRHRRGANPESLIASQSSKTIVEDRDGTTELVIDVPPATAKLFVVMTAAGESAAGELPTDSRVDLVDPDGRPAQSALPPHAVAARHRSVLGEAHFLKQ